MELLNNKSLLIEKSAPYRIGIVGGMGPMAGVFLQKLIIEATPAQKDQDHIQVLCFTNPQIKDRTASLANDGGKGYLTDIVESACLLENAGVNIIVIPCNTAHARLPEIQKSISVPVVDMITVGLESIITKYGGISVGLLATEGTIRENIYQNNILGKRFKWITPSLTNQQKIMEIIYAIKAGKGEGEIDALLPIAQDLIIQGAQVILLGCTELSMYFDYVVKNIDYPVFDPLRAVAQYLVKLKYESATYDVFASEIKHGAVDKK